MTDYTKLVAALRCGEYKPECGASDCPYWSGLGCMDGQLMTDASDAIENLERQVENLKQENRFLKSMQRGIAENMELDSLGKMVARAMREVKYE